MGSVSGKPNEFSLDVNRNLVDDIANRITTALLRLKFGDLEMRRQRLLSKFHEISTEFPHEMELNKLYREVVRLGSKLLSAKGGIIFEGLTDLDALRPICFFQVRQFESIQSLPLQKASRGVLQDGRSVAISADTDLESPWRQLLAQCPTLALVPLQIASPDFNHLLLLAFDNHRELSQEAELDVLDSFAARASSLLSHALLIDPNNRALTHIQTLYELATFAYLEADRRKVMRAVLTAITAIYGLRFNRAAILLLARSGDTLELVGEEGIGALDKPGAERDWENFRNSPLKTFQAYLAALRDGLGNESDLNKSISSIRIFLGDHSEFLRQVILYPNAYRVSPDRLPKELVERIAAGDVHEIAAVPLRSADNLNVEGLLLADNKHTPAPITDQDLDLLLKFGRIAAHAAARSRQIPNVLSELAALGPPIDASPQGVLDHLTEGLCDL